MNRTKRKAVKPKIIGLHVFGNLYGISRAKLTNKGLLSRAVLEAVKKADMKLVEQRTWSFGGSKGGISVIALVSESHMTLHTWVEYGYATIDIYTCGDQGKPYAAFDYLVSTLKPKSHKVFHADRSSL